jgi:spermidine/putrescine-binding protein
MKIIKSLFAFATVFSINATNTKVVLEEWQDLKDFNELLKQITKSSQKKDFLNINISIEKLQASANNLNVENLPVKYRFPKVFEGLLNLKRATNHLKTSIDNQNESTQISENLKATQLAYKKLLNTCYKKI